MMFKHQVQLHDHSTINNQNKKARNQALLRYGLTIIINPIALKLTSQGDSYNTLGPSGGPQVVTLQDLSEEQLKVEVSGLKQLFDTEQRRAAAQQVTLGQLLLQSTSHVERVKLLRSAIKVERVFAAAEDPEHQGVAFVG